MAEDLGLWDSRCLGEPQHPGTSTPPRSLPRLVPSGKPLLVTLFLLLILTPVPVTAKTNLTQCGERVKGLAKNNSLPLEDIYTGHVKGVLGQARNSTNPVLLITFAACEKYCGAEPEYYGWEKSSDTITTWVLPLVGLVLQAPFESNNFLQTIFVVFRWVGSPIVSMMCIFWNMKVTRKCAIMVDMSVEKDQYPPPSSGVGFAELRDSFYLLSVINQYELNIHTQREERHTETILRVGLFDRNPEIQRMRAKVATSIRRERRRGTVQVLVSLAWFLVAMGISINKAFGDLGENATAHNLALGLLMSWLPVLMAATIVDRNPMDVHYVRAKLNKYFRDIEVVEPPNIFPGVEPEVFGEFAGQGRVRWHYGVAHSFLRTLEAMHGMERGWLKKFSNADELSTTRTYSGLLKFDLSELWQMSASFLMVCSCSLGAFFVSYYTPTVGLGCRSGGYMIFGLNAIGCLLMEMAAWAFLYPGVGRRIAQWVLRICEFTNFCWLVYIIFAQTFGIYNSCRCKSSMWGGAGGYVDFEGVPYYKSYHIERSWMLGTLITCVFLGIGLVYVVEQWCAQSFLWTQDWDSAMNGLWWVRQWKWATTGPRLAAAWVAGYMAKAKYWVRTVCGSERHVEDHLLWS